MPVCIVLNSDGLIVNRIVVDENTPADFSPAPGLVCNDTTEAEIEIDGERVTVPMDIGGRYINGVYTPPDMLNLPQR